MKKTFAEYLVGKGALSSQILLDAIMSQVTNVPSTSEIVYKHKLLSSEKMVDALILQSKKRIDFVSACKELGLWNDGIQDKVITEIGKIQIPLMQVLIQSQQLSLEQINKLFDGYISESSEQPADEVTPEADPQPQLQQKSEPSSDTSSTSDVELSVSILEFLNQFDESAENVLIALMETLSKKEHLALGIELAHRLLGAAQFAKLETMQMFFTTVESVFYKIQKTEGTDEIDFKPVSENMSSAFEVIKRLRSYVSEKGNETGYGSAFPQDKEILIQSMKNLKGWTEAK